MASHRSGKAKKVRYAVVGLGHIAQVAVLPAFAHAKRNSELVSVVSGDPIQIVPSPRTPLSRTAQRPPFWTRSGT
jgi:hypothetical protein